MKSFSIVISELNDEINHCGLIYEKQLYIVAYNK